MQAAKEVGGDFYDHFPIDDTHYAFLVADVSGKGITAALYMMTAKTLIKDALLAFRTPAAALEAVNSELCHNNPANMFLTAWVGVLNMETGDVSFANAGHNPPAAFRKGEWAYVPAKSGPALALMGGISYEPHQITLEEGDAIFLYTDGVTEALDPSKVLFGEERLANALVAVKPPEPSSLCNVVRAAVTAFEAGEAQADDITVLALRRLAAPRIFSRAFPPSIDSIAVATEFLDEKLGENGSPTSLLPVMNVMLDEVCSNIVKHSGASMFEVDVEFLPNPPSVKLTFVDDGVAYNPLSHKDPDTSLSAEERPIGGLGILMVKKMATSISYIRKHGRNFLSVVKDFA
jgi:sigma-B regulation protein RsbU (phosphoserine phosphatase)